MAAAIIQSGASVLRAQPAEIPVPQFENPPANISDAGHIRLTWKLPEGVPSQNGVRFLLQQAADPAFSAPDNKYEGPDLASFISGLPDGTYYFRVRVQAEGGSPSNPWSSPVVVTVQHQSLTLAFTLFGLGAVVFVATVILVVVGNRKTEEPA